jgi:amino acid permease
MLAKHFRRDSAIKLICVFALAVHGLSFGLTQEYLETFILYPVLTGVFGFLLGAHRRPPDREAAEREAERVAPELLLKMLVPVTILSLAGTTFVVLYDMYAGSFARFEWWPIVMGLLCGNSIGSLVRLSKRD